MFSLNRLTRLGLTAVLIAGIAVVVPSKITPASAVLDATGAVFSFGVTGQTVEDVNDLDTALLPGAAITYRGVATIQGTVIDAVVTFVAGANLIGQNAPLNHIRRIDNNLGSGLEKPFIESQVRTTTNLEAWARLKVDFYTSGSYTVPASGTPVQLANLSVHFYDVDNEQSVEVTGASTYTLASNTHVIPSVTSPGSIKFTSPNVNTSEDTGTAYTVGRVTATWAQTSSFEYRLFVPFETSGSFEADVSPGRPFVDNGQARTQTVTVNPPFLTPLSRTYSGIVNCPINMAPPLATNFGGTVSYASTSGTTPTGLTFNSNNGGFAGTPTTISSETVGISATGSVSGSATAAVTFDITDPVMTVAPSTQVVSGVRDTVVSASTALTVTHPCSSVTYSITSGTLPAGLSLDSSTGVITGTPTATSNASVTITATDTSDNARTATATVTFAVSGPVVSSPAPSDPGTSAPIASAPIASAPIASAPVTSAASPTPVRAANGGLPQLGSAETLVLEDGVPVVVELVVEDDSDLVLRNQDFELRLRGACTTGCTITNDSTGRETIHLDRNGGALVSGFGFLPGSQVHVWVFSEPRYLGALLVQPDGTFEGSFSLADLEVGGHTLQTNGFSFDNVPRSANLGIVVVDAEGMATVSLLPSAGSGTNLALLAMVVLGFGSLLMGMRRRRWSHDLAVLSVGVTPDETAQGVRKRLL